MCFGGMPAMPAMPETPKVVDQTQVKQSASPSAVATASGKRQTEIAGSQGTMLTEGVGVDPATLELGKKTLLGG